MILRSSHCKCSIKKVFLKFYKIHKKTPALESLFQQRFRPQASLLFTEYTFFIEKLVSASVV